MTKNSENIVLVPTDFTEVANYAIDHAAGIAKQLKGKVVLLHVINKETKAYLKKEKLNDATITEKLKTIAASVEQKYNVTLDYLTKEGSIFTTIAEVTNEIGARIIVMGTHGKIGVQHLIGSFALKVIEGSPVPVIVVQEKDFGHGYKNIVMPIDETTETKQKVNWAIHIAKRFDAIIHPVHETHDDEFIDNEIERNVAQIKKFLQDNNVKCVVKSSKENGNSFGKDIMVYASKVNADMVMFMTNPHQLLPSFILAPWAEQVIFNSYKIPAMCINPVDFAITYISF